MSSSRKIGRNEPCPCGSGKKYKRCHGQLHRPNLIADRGPEFEKEIRQKLEELKAAERQRQKQQGLGRGIVSLAHNGYRFVAVGNELKWSKNWQTFHDFLFDYIKTVVGPEWGNEELKKPYEARHPIIQLYDMVCRYQAQHKTDSRGLYSAPFTGAVAIYLGLAYNLYLLAHNVAVQTRLIQRLKDAQLFRGAYYETFVAAALIKAGFTIEFEDESDKSSTHCEFTASCRTSGGKYSVEAKHRHYGADASGVVGVSNDQTPDPRVARHLYRSLRKRALHTRIVFIDANVPEQMDTDGNARWIKHALKVLRREETHMTIDGSPAPSAYVVLTNDTSFYGLMGVEWQRSALAEGFKIPDFKMDTPFETIRDALHSRERHADMFQLLSSIREHYEIPSTFDGEIPEFAFGEAVPRLKIGQHYLVPDADGVEKTSELTDAIVVEQEKQIYGIYLLEDGNSIIVTCPITDAELSAYRRHPDTFFGVRRRHGSRAKSPLELYDFFFESYRTTPRKRLLEFLKTAADIEALKKLTQEELASIYSERCVYGVLAKS